MTFLDDAWPVIVPFLAAFLVPRLPVWALPCAAALGATGFVLSLSSTINVVAIIGAASNTVLTVFSILTLVKWFILKKRGVFDE